MIGFSEGRFLIHSTPFTVVAMPPAFRKNQRSAHRQSKQVVSFLVKTKGSLKYNLPFWTPMHPVRLPVQNLGISRYSCDFTH
jgi:hypothetical protein